MRPRRTAWLCAAALAASMLGSLPGDGAAESVSVRIVSRDTIVRTKTDSAPVRTREVHDISSRGERTRLLVETVDHPSAVAVLFAGGKGAMRLSEDGDIGWGNGNFLIRSRPYFLKNGVVTAIIDAPTDHKRDLRHGFRGSDDHATDVAAAVAHLRASFDVPIWLVGTSRGTNSVANAAARLGDAGADGIVLTASMLAWNEKGDNLLDFPLERITGPVFIAHHEDDECFVTPPEKVPELVSRLTSADPVRVALYSGGNGTGNPCHVAHYHGFNGIEEDVVADIVTWMKAPAP
jgi:hypothetical protein